MMDFNGAERYAKHGTFSVANETDKHRLDIGDYSGKLNKIRIFSTKNATVFLTAAISADLNQIMTPS